MAKSLPSLSIVVPTYNERDNLGFVVADLVAFAQAALTDFEIVVVDDGSQDGSVDTLPQGPTVRVLKHEHNRGLTAALRTGFFGAQKEFVTWVPADGQIPPAELGKILAAWNGHDLVLSTYRHRPDGLVRALMSRSLRLLLYLSTGFRDRLEGVYLFRRSLLDEMTLVSATSAGSIGFEIALKTRALHRRIATTEIECATRRSGESKVANTRNVAAYFREIWRIRQSMK